MRAVRCSLWIAVALLSTAVGCDQKLTESDGEAFGLAFAEAFLRNDPHIKEFHSEVLASAVGRSAPSGGPSAIYSITHLVMVDSVIKTPLPGEKEPKSEFERRMQTKMADRYSPLHLFDTAAAQPPAVDTK